MHHDFMMSGWQHSTSPILHWVFSESFTIENFGKNNPSNAAVMQSTARLSHNLRKTDEFNWKERQNFVLDDSPSWLSGVNLLFDFFRGSIEMFVVVFSTQVIVGRDGFLLDVRGIIK